MTLIMEMDTLSYNELMELSFGDYIQVQKEKTVTNTMSECTNDAIALFPSGNLQGGWKVLSLNEGRVHHRRQWQLLPLTQHIIDPINIFGKRQGSNEFDNSDLDLTSSGSCGKSVIFPHLVGFHSSRQNIY